MKNATSTNSDKGGDAPLSQAVARAVELLREEADVVRDSCTDTNGNFSMISEKEDHDKLVRAAADLENAFAVSDTMPSWNAALNYEEADRIAYSTSPMSDGRIAVLARAYIALRSASGDWNAALEAVLDEVEDFLEQQKDVVDGSYGEPHPNAAMSLLSELQRYRALKSQPTDTAPGNEPSDPQVEAAEGGSSRPAPAESDANGKSLSQVDNGVEVLGCRPVQTGQGPTPERYLSVAAATALPFPSDFGIPQEYAEAAQHFANALRSGPFAEGYEAAREDAAIRADNYAAYSEAHEAYERQAGSLDIAESIRALPTRERK